MKTVTRITAILFICLLASACSKPLSRAIVGRWENTGEPGFLEFFVDNTIVVNDGTHQFTGKWVVAGNNRIKADMAAGLGATATLFFEDIHISDNTFTCTFQGQKIESKRAQ